MKVYELLPLGTVLKNHRHLRWQCFGIMKSPGVNVMLPSLNWSNTEKVQFGKSSRPNLSQLAVWDNRYHFLGKYTNSKQLIGKVGGKELASSNE